MATDQTRGIVNGHWERSEPRSAWLLMLARMSLAELHILSESARDAARRLRSREHSANDDDAAQAVAAE